MADVLLPLLRTSAWGNPRVGIEMMRANENKAFLSLFFFSGTVGLPCFEVPSSEGLN